MPTETIIVLTGVIALFSSFAGMLAYADFTSLPDNLAEEAANNTVSGKSCTQACKNGQRCNSLNNSSCYNSPRTETTSSAEVAAQANAAGN